MSQLDTADEMIASLRARVSSLTAENERLRADHSGMLEANVRLRDERDGIATEAARIATLAEQAADALASLHSEAAMQVRRAYESVAVGLRKALAALPPTPPATEGSDVQDR